jgi:hypothetical protein
MRAAVGGVMAAAAWSWALLRRLAALRPRRSRRPDRQSETRRSYVFGAISRQAFEAAMKKSGWPSSRRRRRDQA